jgi:hypothetical protein
MLKKFGIKEMVQTGKIALLKGESSKKWKKKASTKLPDTG